MNRKDLLILTIKTFLEEKSFLPKEELEKELFEAIEKSMFSNEALIRLDTQIDEKELKDASIELLKK